MGRFVPMSWCVCVAAKLGANAILGVSLAVCKAGAAKKVCMYSRCLIADSNQRRETISKSCVSGKVLCN